MSGRSLRAIGRPLVLTAALLLNAALICLAAEASRSDAPASEISDNPALQGATNMSDAPDQDLARLDRPEILAVIFHPRPDYPTPPPATSQEVYIPVSSDAVVAGRLHPATPGAPDAPTLLFFHGNGEIVADYDPIAPQFTTQGLNFLPVDYRGYGRSTGRPSVSALLNDSLLVFDAARSWLDRSGQTGPILVMGRSLGSAPALELAFRRGEDVAGLIIESGFSRVRPLLLRLGLHPSLLEKSGKAPGVADGIDNLDKITRYSRPTLIIHGVNDAIIPVKDARELFAASPAVEKTLLEVPGAGHNDLFLVSRNSYLAAVATLARQASGRNAP